MRQRRPMPITTAYSLIFELLKTEAEYVREIVAFFPTAGERILLELLHANFQKRVISL